MPSTTITKVMLFCLILMLLRCGGEKKQSHKMNDTTADRLQKLDSTDFDSGPDYQTGEIETGPDKPHDIWENIDGLQDQSAQQITDTDAAEVADTEPMEQFEPTDSADSTKPVDYSDFDGGETVPVKLPTLDQYGGFAEMQIQEGTGYFTIAYYLGRLWLVDPAGNAYFATGVTSVGFGGSYAPDLGYSPTWLCDAFHNATVGIEPDSLKAKVIQGKIDRIKSYGFNCIGGWSNSAAAIATGQMPYTISLNFSSAVKNQSITATPVPGVNESGFPDVFHPGFAPACHDYVQSAVPDDKVNDAWLIGYFLDNELHWFGKKYWIESKTYTLADDFIALPPSFSGKQAWVNFMTERYGGDITKFNAAYQTDFEDFSQLLDVTKLPYDPQVPSQYQDRMEFVRLIAQTYFQGTVTALKQRDPNHLNLCIRFASIAPDVVVEQAGKWCDVVSVNDYFIVDKPLSIQALGGQAEQRWQKMAQLVMEGAGEVRPFLLTEFGIKAQDSGMPNVKGAGWTVATQLERLQFYQFTADWLITRQIADTGYVVGWHWFEYYDQPPTGRFDGEDSNFGITTVCGLEYQDLLEGMKSVNLTTMSKLVFGESGKVLPPPQIIEAGLDQQSGHLSLSWPQVDGAETYTIYTLLHPAGVENARTVMAETAATEFDIFLQGMGNGYFWFAVSANAVDAFTVGSRVVGPFEISDSPECVLEQVLSCQTLCATHFDNKPNYPNDKAGLSYAFIELDEESGYREKLVFVPSSLGFVSQGLADPEVRVKIVLPQLWSTQGFVVLHLLPYFHLTPTKEYLASTRFISVRIIGADGTILVDQPLDPDKMHEPFVPYDVVVSLACEEPNCEVKEIEFYLDITQVELALEQPIIFWLDSIE